MQMHQLLEGTCAIFVCAYGQSSEYKCTNYLKEIVFFSDTYHTCYEVLRVLFVEQELSYFNLQTPILRYLKLSTWHWYELQLAPKFNLVGTTPTYASLGLGSLNDLNVGLLRQHLFYSLLGLVEFTQKLLLFWKFILVVHKHLLIKKKNYIMPSKPSNDNNSNNNMKDGTKEQKPNQSRRQRTIKSYWDMNQSHREQLLSCYSSSASISSTSSVQIPVRTASSTNVCGRNGSTGGTTASGSGSSQMPMMVFNAKNHQRFQSYWDCCMDVKNNTHQIHDWAFHWSSRWLNMSSID